MSLFHDLPTLKLMTAELPDYLLSDVLFWQMQAPSHYPKLSLGLWLFTRAGLEALLPQLPLPQQTEVEKANLEADALLARKPAAAEKKAAQELRSRINLWKAYLDDYGEDPDNAGHYTDEVTQRVIAALLLRRLPRLADSAEAQRLLPLDSFLRALLKRSPFIWPAERQPAFPEDDFWFLYGRLG